MKTTTFSVACAAMIIGGVFANFNSSQGQDNESRIAWYGTLKTGLAEAERTQKPILLISAAPQCVGVSGIWWPGKQNIDRSFLSNEQVVNASRNYVCIRLATYEDKDEAEFLKSIIKTRSGELENTVFTILAPDGKEKLARADRGPFQFRNARILAENMDQIFEKYSDNAETGNPVFPYMKNFELALNVASADRIPLVVVVANKDSDATQLEEKIAEHIWSKDFSGQFVYVKVSDIDEMEAVTGDKKSEGIYLVEPGKFGVSGKIAGAIGQQSSSEEISTAMSKAIEDMPRELKEHHTHVRAGIKLGIDWQSAIPETDPDSIRAREQMRGAENQSGGEGTEPDNARRGGPPAGPGQGPSGGPRQRDPKRFVEHAMTFDADGDGKLDAEELTKFAEQMGQRGPPQGGERPSGGGPGTRPDRGKRPPGRNGK